MEREFTAVIRKRGRWFVAYVEEVPGANTQGRTLAETRRNLKEAVQLVVETNRELAAKGSPRVVKREPITIDL